MNGQLWRKERRFVHDMVHDCGASVCYEVGTNRGGGSTLAIVRALSLLGRGILHTAETDHKLVEEAVASFYDEMPTMMKYVRFYLGDACEQLRNPLAQSLHVDFVFLDGSEDPKETMEQVEMFEAFSTPHTVFCAHDWGTSRKMALLKPIIDSGEKHEYIARIYPHGTGFQDGSVGIAAWRMKV